MLYPTATYANRDINLGTCLVQAFTASLNGLSEDVSLMEFLRLVQNRIINNKSMDKHQTAQIVVFQHEKITFQKK
jgi:hypothetical protein